MREGSPLALLQRRPWPKATSREASGRQDGVRGKQPPPRVVVILSSLVILRSPTRQSRYGDGASEATKDLLPSPQSQITSHKSSPTPNSSLAHCATRVMPGNPSKPESKLMIREM